MRTEARLTQPQAKECRQPVRPGSQQKLGEARNRLPLSLVKEHSPTNTLTSAQRH